jgi:tetratricopeptide (TPR) repeat protein
MVKNKTGWNRYFLWRFFTILLLGALFVLTGGTGSAAPAGSLPVITVSTPEEFMMAIGPDRIIRIEAEVLQLPNEKVPFASDYVTQQEVIDGYQLLIHDVANLTITGAGEKPVKILAEPRYAYILAFLNAEKITIEAVEAGHTPGDEGCITGVLHFKDCREIVVDRSILFGCGSEGVDLQDVDGFLFRDSEIKECVFGIMNINQSRNCLFLNSTFKDNEGWYLINIDQAENIRFSGCRIENNIAYESEYSSIFDVSKSAAVVVEDCLVENNIAEWFIHRGTGLTVSGTPVDNNLFYQGYSFSETYGYHEYYSDLRFIEFLRTVGGLAGTDTREEIQKICKEKIDALLAIEREQGAGDLELEYLLGTYYTFAYQEELIADRSKAEERFQNILDIDPFCTPAYLGLGDLYFQESITQKLERFNGDDLGFVFSKKGRRNDKEFMEKALAGYLQAVRIEEEFGLQEIAPVVHYRIMVLYCFTGQPGTALEYAKRLAAINPEHYKKCLDTLDELVKKKRVPRKIEFIF